jgi:tRNA threonylcarbamoyladenosine biosynthesis protein TsaB
MSRLLVIDTSSSICTVALAQDDLSTVRQIEGPRSHGQFLLSTIEEVIKLAGVELGELDALAVVAGPGSFTGIRIGVGVVQGLATALNVPVILLSSLEWLARSAFAKHNCSAALVCRIARDSEYYFACYVDQRESDQGRLGPEKIGAAQEIVLPDAARNKSIAAVGDGWLDLDAFNADLLTKFSLIDPELEGDADSLCELARGMYEAGRCVSAEQAVPSYLKENMNYKTAI